MFSMNKSDFKASKIIFLLYTMIRFKELYFRISNRVVRPQPESYGFEISSASTFKF